MKATQEPLNLTARLGRVIVFFALAVVLVTFVVVHILAWHWASEPFLGMLLEPTLVLSPFKGQDWARLQFTPPLEQPDRLIAIDGKPVQQYKDVAAILREREVGQEVTVTVARPDGSLREETITLTTFPLTDMVLLFLLPFLAGLVYLGIGVWVYWVRGWGRAGQVFAVFCAAVALMIISLFETNTTHRLSVLWCASLPLAAATAVHLALVFPQPPRFVQRFPILRLLPYLPALYFAFRAISSVYDVAHPWAYLRDWYSNYIFVVIGILCMLGTLLYRLIKPPSPLVRQQSRIILLGATLAFLPVVPWILILVQGQLMAYPTWLFTPLFVIFPLYIA